MARNRSRPVPPLPTIFLDRDLDADSIYETLIHKGINVVRHKDLFPQNAEDAEWLPRVGAEGWFVLTHDGRIRYRTLEIQALKHAKVGMFVLVAKNPSGDVMASIVGGAIHRIIQATRTRKRPFIAKIGRDSKLTLLDIDRYR